MRLRHILPSAATGLILSFTLAYQFFSLDNLSRVDRLFLIFIPAIAIAVCACYLIPPLASQLEQTSSPAKIFLFSLALLSSFIIVFASFNSLNILSVGAFLSLTLIFLAGTLPSAPFIQKALGTQSLSRILPGWLISTILLFFTAGFLDNYYNSFLQFVCLIVFLQMTVGLAGYFLSGRFKQFLKLGTADVSITTALFLLLIIFIFFIFSFGSQYPQLLNPALFTLKRDYISVFFAVSLFSLPWLTCGLDVLQSKQFFKIKETRIYAFINENTAGLLLALGFFALYFITASMLNHPRFDVDDVFFDADVFNWRFRLTTDNWGDYYWRSVHPFILILFKPPIDLIAFFLKGDKLFAAYIFVALGGAASVFLAWRFIRNLTSSPTYPMLVSSLLGLSVSHLIFGSLIESYIFLALCLLLFYVLLAEGRPFPALVMAGLATIGITHSNFAQNVIALFTVKPNIKLIIRYIATVLVILVLLTLLNNLLYPASQPFFFIPSTLQAEQQNIFPLNTLRIQALARAFLFHNVVAPTPILFTGDIPFVQFRFFKPEINSLSRYETPLQDLTAWFWIGLLALAATTYLVNFKKNRYQAISLALAACILMNLALHLRYGKELFLYSPNWTYAVILLAGLGWQGLARQRWFHILLLAFLALLAINNGLLLRGIFDILAPQI
jgi:hypothetical protein